MVFVKKTFSQKHSLISHALTHSGLKPYTCTVCGRAFACNGNLKKHLIIHSREKAYQCIVCGKTFTQEEDLKSHSVIHSGEKPHVCSMCGKSFIDQSTYESHVLSHGSNSICNIGGEIFIDKLVLQKHYLQHTEDSQKSSLCSEQISTSSEKEVQEKYLPNKSILVEYFEGHELFGNPANLFSDEQEDQRNITKMQSENKLKLNVAVDWSSKSSTAELLVKEEESNHFVKEEHDIGYENNC